MADELTRSLLALADRGRPRGADTVLDEARRIVGTPVSRRFSPSAPVAAIVAAVVIFLVIGVVVAAMRWTGPNPPPVITTPTSTSTTTSTTAAIPGLSAGYLESAIGRSGIHVWAGNSTEIWSYSEGSWSYEASIPSGCWATHYAADTFWILCEDGLYEREETEWRRAEAPLQSSGWLKSAPGSRVLWWSNGDDLYRWDGVEVTNLGHAGQGHTYLGQITVTTDGTIWADGSAAWTPWNGGSLARYDPRTQIWETVQPVDAHHLPAQAMAPAPDGGLWVLLYDWPDLTALPPGSTTAPTWALAHLDGATGEWSVYDENLPAGFPTEMTCDDEAVWLFGRYTSASQESGFHDMPAGILRFDGRTWTTYLNDTVIYDVTVAADGTVWYLAGGELRQLQP